MGISQSSMFAHQDRQPPLSVIFFSHIVAFRNISHLFSATWWLNWVRIKTQPKMSIVINADWVRSEKKLIDPPLAGCLGADFPARVETALPWGLAVSFSAFSFRCRPLHLSLPCDLRSKTVASFLIPPRAGLLLSIKSVASFFKRVPNFKPWAVRSRARHQTVAVIRSKDEPPYFPRPLSPERRPVSPRTSCPSCPSCPLLIERRPPLVARRRQDFRKPLDVADVLQGVQAIKYLALDGAWSGRFEGIAAVGLPGKLRSALVTCAAEKPPNSWASSQRC